MSAMSSLRCMPILRSSIRAYKKSIYQASKWTPLLISAPTSMNQISNCSCRWYGEKASSVAFGAGREESLLERILQKIPFLNIRKHRMSVFGLMLYESIADRVNYRDFFQEFALPDTFYSWFAVTELHVWLLSVRCMAEGEDGRHVRNRMIEAMWSDVGLRVKKLGIATTPAIRAQVKELSEQFQAALIAYDEGLQSNDMVLAGALWRRLYQMKTVDPEDLEMLVKYTRRQITLLDNTSTDDLFRSKPISWVAR